MDLNLNQGSISNDGEIYGHKVGIVAWSGIEGGTINNTGSGLIRSDHTGIDVYTDIGLATTINNGANATIRGSVFSVYTHGAGGIRLTNDGKLIGNIHCAAPPDEIDRVINRGTISGNVGLGFGADSYLGGGTGSVSGSVSGGYGNDSLTGGSLADRLKGDGNTDILIGNGGNDVLSGGTGVDKLSGGLGIDLLSGGTDVDFFIFNTGPNTATNRDTITDFSHNDDTLQFENAVFTTLGAPGMLKAAFFRLGAAAADADDRIIYNQATGIVTYDVNGNAAGGVQQVAILTNKPVLALGDFVVI